MQPYLETFLMMLTGLIPIGAASILPGFRLVYGAKLHIHQLLAC